MRASASLSFLIHVRLRVILRLIQLHILKMDRGRGRQDYLILENGIRQLERSRIFCVAIEVERFVSQKQMLNKTFTNSGKRLSRKRVLARTLEAGGKNHGGVPPPDRLGAPAPRSTEPDMDARGRPPVRHCREPSSPGCIFSIFAKLVF